MLVDNLNAEIVLGTVTNVREAVAWLSYTYLNTRIRRNPLAYGLTYPVGAEPLTCCVQSASMHTT
jgi:replicative superfamily II helicase